MAPRGKKVEADFQTSTFYFEAMTDIANGAPLTFSPVKPKNEIIPTIIRTKDGPIVVHDTELTDEDGTSAALYNLWALTGFDPDLI